jgi:hypothetical protein
MFSSELLDAFQQRSPENGHILNGTVPYAETKLSIGPAETRPYMVVQPSILLHINS